MTWLKDKLFTEKAVIAVCHLDALPGDPHLTKQVGWKK